MIKAKNFGAANNEELKMENGKLKINGIKHPNIFNSQLSIFNSKKRYGFTLGEDTEIVSEDVNLSPLRGKYPPEAGERGLKRGCHGQRMGFTLAEVLITLVVIGVVAAITIPVLHSNTGGKEWNAAKQKARAGLGEAFKLISVQNELPDITADEFARTVLPKYIKLAKNCTSAVECGFADKIKTVKGTEIQTSSILSANSKWSGMMPSGGTTSDGTHAVSAAIELAYEPAFFRTVDGFSVAMFYNPRCRAGEADNTFDSLTSDTSIGAACFSAIYDMNGKKGPNRAGDDIGFVGSFFYGMQARSAAVLPVKDGMNLLSENTFDQASEICKKAGRAGDYDLPAIDELTLIYLNDRLTGDTSRVWAWSRSAAGGNSNLIRDVDFNPLCPGVRRLNNRTVGHAVRCVRADKLM